MGNPIKMLESSRPATNPTFRQASRMLVVALLGLPPWTNASRLTLAAGFNMDYIYMVNVGEYRIILGVYSIQYNAGTILDMDR